MRTADLNKTGIIFNIQKFSVNDGPGIRTVVFFKGCPLQCKWCSNPESQLLQRELLWNRQQCRACRHCTEICPTDAITFSGEAILIESKKCIGCQQCIAECPAKALKMEGDTRTVKDVLDIVMQDKVFYDESGGGMTLSGGEFLSQSDFAIELLIAAKESGLHTCCETTGFADKDIFNSVIEYVDYLLFDIKHWNSEKHKAGTGMTNKLPLINLQHAIKLGKEVLPRIPVIPGFNDSTEDALGLAKLLVTAGAKHCQLLPFHQFGENKYHLLNKTYDYENTPALHREDLQDYLNLFISHGIKAFF